MKISEKHLGKLVRVIVDDDRENLVGVYAFPSWEENWLDYAADHEYFHCENSVVMPIGTYGTIVAQAFVSKHVTFNYAKVLFPATKLFPVGSCAGEIIKNEAGAYWISGEFLELVPEDEY